MFINDRDVGTDSFESAELREHTVREQGTVFTSCGRWRGRHERSETAVRMCMKTGDSERQGERA